MPHTRKRLLWQLPFLALLTVGTVLIIRSQRNAPYRTERGTVFGTLYKITYQSDRDLKKDIERRLQEVDNELSLFNPQSTLSKINRGENPDAGRMFTDVFRLAQSVAEDTGGAFDITVAPLVNAWGFGYKHGQLPTRPQVDSLRQIIGYKKVRLAGAKVVKTDPRVTLDCGAIAKGYGVDAVAALLQDRGVDNFMVEIGGEIVIRGINEQRVPWRIGVNKPIEDSTAVATEVQAVINVTDRAIATSGNYRNFYYRDGKRYAHTIDPRTGYPVQHNVLSATVVADRCATADAYATAFMVVGFEEAGRILKRHPEILAYIIYSDSHGQNAVWYSPSLKEKIDSIQ